MTTDYLLTVLSKFDMSNSKNISNIVIMLSKKCFS